MTAFKRRLLDNRALRLSAAKSLIIAGTGSMSGWSQANGQGSQ